MPAGGGRGMETEMEMEAEGRTGVRRGRERRRKVDGRKSGGCR